ncbi:MAG: rhomboid family intramembrane serine protease [Rhodomicrobium sp.]
MYDTGDTGDTGEEKFAAYLAKALIAKKGYRPGTVPEAHELSAHCDAVLTRADGLTVSIVAIVDREADPTRRFGLAGVAVEEIGRACLRYSGTAGGRKLPVSITVIETGAASVPPEDKDRLKSLKSRSLFSKVHISAFALGVSKQELWTNTPVRGRAMRSFLRRLLTGPRLSNAQLMPKPPAAMPEHRPLVLTYGLLAVLAAVFACEYAFRVSPSNGLLDPGIRTLIALGALDKSLVVEDGQWWRLFSAPLLHGGPLHIALNGVALFFAGAVLENVTGRAWFAAIFAVSAIAGAAMSLLINPGSLISVGASGAIMGLFAAAFAAGYRYPAESRMRGFLVSGSLRVLIPSMIPLFGGLTGGPIDYAAHLGGAVGGVVTGALLVLIWRREELLPPYRKLAWAVAAAGLCGVLYSGVQVANGYEGFDLAASLVPEQQIPKDLGAAEAKSAELVEAYPRDPRSHMYRAMTLMDAGDSAGAERERKAALAAGKMLQTFFKPELEAFIRANLAAAMKKNGKISEAQETAKPVCAAKGELSNALAKEGLCF